MFAPPPMLVSILLTALLLVITVACGAGALRLWTRDRRSDSPGHASHLPAWPYREPPAPNHANASVPSSRRWWGRHGVVADVLVALSLASAAAMFIVVVSWEAQPYERRWTFTHEHASTGALGLVAKSERAGTWQLESDPRATGARALVNHLGAPGAAPAVLVSADPTQRDVRVRTRCRARASGSSPACGLVLRYRDEANHYAARLDLAAQRVVLSVVSSGQERVLAHAPARLGLDVWHEIAVEARRDRIQVHWNGDRVIDTTDVTLLTHGATGLWTPSDAIAHFDELSVEQLSTETFPILSPAPLFRGFRG